jgi:hypothetical protein
MTDSLLRIFQNSQRRLEIEREMWERQVIAEIGDEFYQEYETEINSRLDGLLGRDKSPFSAAMVLWEEEMEMMEEKWQKAGIPQEEINRRLEAL